MRNDHLARRSDGETSKEAAELLDLSFNGRAFRLVKRWLQNSKDGMGTYRELGEMLAARGIVPSWEEGRRAARTMKEEHDLLEWALDRRGKHLRHTNSTDRKGWCLQLVRESAPVTQLPKRVRLIPPA